MLKNVVRSAEGSLMLDLLEGNDRSRRHLVRAYDPVYLDRVSVHIPGEYSQRLGGTVAADGLGRFASRLGGVLFH